MIYPINFMNSGNLNCSIGMFGLWAGQDSLIKQPLVQRFTFQRLASEIVIASHVETEVLNFHPQELVHAERGPPNTESR